MTISKFFCSILFTAFSFSLACQNIEPEAVPEGVQAAFQQKYPDEKDPDWSIDKNGNYEAKFKRNGLKYRADITPDGIWIETETNIKKKDLPKAIEDYIKENFDMDDIEEIELVIHHTKGTFYDVELKDKGEKFDVEVNVHGIRIN